MVYILIYILIYAFNNEQLHSHINLYIKKEHVLVLRDDDLYFIYTFQMKSSLV